MLNIGIHGFGNAKLTPLCKKINLCIQAIGLEKSAVKEVFRSSVFSCDGEEKHMPYLRIFSSEPEYILRILAGFQQYGIHEDVEVFPDMFFEASEIASGTWSAKICQIEMS